MHSAVKKTFFFLLASSDKEGFCRREPLDRKGEKKEKENGQKDCPRNARNMKIIPVILK